MGGSNDKIASDILFEWLLRRGDTVLVLGHRVSEWCGHSPVLEEDIALANVALDLIGQARMWLSLAGEVEGKGRGENELAYLRDAWDFRNVLLAEQPNGDFGKTLMRQFLIDTFQVLQLKELETSADPRIAAIAAKAGKEAAYHLDRSADLVIRLGDGTPESHRRMQDALDQLWSYTGELFTSDEIDQAMSDAGLAPDPASLKSEWQKTVDEVLAEATLTAPDSAFAHLGGLTGRHSEHLGHLLAEMQFLQRAYPGATW
ncbi:1,2-phenylacetyl-CoA epoxidase subunit PaaC [Roseibium sediminicola]|uniref:Phenylacetate-CoA oxygenase subunit PaaC n=1 Tax=Roseibium sediminicola TaxID=2933272 RepID=A0ABT0GPV7_9HYPH|nr:1,2-phenylacetyl-CoA epoxidase subunit PaaC [Roseibium sp. CAU 1639]MCK7611351.1 phenylacetate-CoA oxygenase subunit PaaC [Roseibium sp. CAU 1639]